MLFTYRLYNKNAENSQAEKKPIKLFFFSSDFTRHNSIYGVTII